MGLGMFGDSFHFGQVKYFIQHQEAISGRVHHLAVIQTLTCNSYDPSSHISVISTLNQEANPVIAITVSSICNNCIYICFPDEKDRAYICDFPNRCELE